MTDEKELDILEAEAKAALREILAAMLQETQASNERLWITEAIARLRDGRRAHWTDRDGTRRVSDE